MAGMGEIRSLQMYNERMFNVLNTVNIYNSSSMYSDLQNLSNVMKSLKD